MKDLRGYLYPEEVDKIINSTRNLRDRLLLRLLWVTGCRISELVGERTKKGIIAEGLYLKGVDFRDKALILETLKRKKPYLRRVTIDTETLQMIEE